MQNSSKYINIRDLMIEIEALRALVDEKGVDVETQNEIEMLRRQLTEANDNLKNQGKASSSKHESLI